MTAGIEYGFLSLLPTVVLILMAVLTKRTFEPLVVGTLVAIFIYSREFVIIEFVGIMLVVFSAEAWVILVVGFLGVFMHVLAQTKATLSFSKVLSKYVTTKRGALFLEWLISSSLFIDDYLNILMTGESIKGIIDENKISRPMAAFILGSTAAPISVIIPLSTWVMYFSSLLKNAGVTHNSDSVIGAYILCIPYLYYPIVNMIIVGLVIIGIFPLIGPLRRVEYKTNRIDKRLPKSKDLLNENNRRTISSNNINGSALDYILPLIVMLVITVYQDMDILIGVIAALFFSAGYFFLRRSISMDKIIVSIWEGFNSMISLLGLLIIAFMFKITSDNLGTVPYIISIVEPLLHGYFVPSVVFIISVLITFALANAWGVAAIMIPLVVPLSQIIGVNTYLTVSAVFSGAVLGTQLCFYSDNAILIGKAFDIKPHDHVITQMPFVLISGFIALILYLITGILYW